MITDKERIKELEKQLAEKDKEIEKQKAEHLEFLKELDYSLLKHIK